MMGIASHTNETGPMYTVARNVPVSLPGRRRYQTDIWVPTAAAEADVIAALVDAARATLRADTEAKAACVFAYADDTPVCQGFNRGRAWISRDGLGWTGDGRFPPYGADSDDDAILVTVGEAGGHLEELRIDRGAIDEGARGERS
jgi:hypothetical protein